MATEKLRVWVVVVSYRARLDRLSLQFERLLPQVERILWIDNGNDPYSSEWLEHWQRQGIEPLRLGANYGIGYAQNRGIDIAIAGGATHVLLMDDDSIPESDMVQKLSEVLVAAPSTAAVGPFHMDPRRGPSSSPFIRLNRRGASLPQWIHPVAYLIGSGMLIPVDVFHRIGFLREDYFIDWVDVEWCLRARSHGYDLLGVKSAKMEHSVGSSVARFCGRYIAVYPPWRYYYQTRNFIALLKSGFMPTRLGWMMMLRQLTRWLAVMVVCDRKMACLVACWRGLKDGLLGRMGAPPLAAPQATQRGLER